MLFNKFKKYFPFLAVVIAAVIMLCLVVKPQSSDGNSKACIDVFKKNLQKTIKEVDVLLEKVSEKENLENPFNSLLNNSFVSKYEANDISLFIFKNDTLLFWSDNRVIISQKTKPLNSDSVFFNGNGWYLSRVKEVENYKIAAFILIQSEYFFKNNYLESKINAKLCEECCFKITDGKSEADTTIQISEIQKPIHVLFHDEAKVFSQWQDISIVLLLILSLILLALGLYLLISRAEFLKKKYYLKFILFAIIPPLLFLIGFYFFKIPYYKNLSVVNPVFFAFSSRFTNLFPLLLGSLCFLIGIVYFSRDILLMASKINTKKVFSIFIHFLFFIFTAIAASFIVLKLSNFFFNTSVDFSFNNILTFDFRAILILLTLFFLFISIVLLHYLIISFVNIFNYSFKKLFFVSIVFLIVGIAISFVLKINICVFACVSAYLLLIQFLFLKQVLKNRALFWIMCIILLSAITAVSINKVNKTKKQNKIKILAINLLSEQDPLAEDFLDDIIPKISNDENLKNQLKNNKNFDLTEYLKRNYFGGYLGQYFLQTTWCKPDENLHIKPSGKKENCVKFFNNIAFQFGIPTNSNHAVFINDGTGRGYYLCDIAIESLDDTSFIFAELIPNSYEKGLGYPDLLVDINSGINTLPSNIVFARYLNDDLVSRYGKYNYPTKISDEFKNMPEESFIRENGFIHYKIMNSGNISLIVSEQEQDVASFLAPFSYMLLVFGLLFLLFLFTTGRVFGVKMRLKTSFSSRLQVLIIFIILIVFLIVGIISVLNLNDLNLKKNRELVNEKTHSLVIEIEGKLEGLNGLSENDKFYLTDLLLNFSKVFFTDLNVYNIDGKLLSTTRPQIFEKELISERMNANAFYAFKILNNSFFLQKEKIGKMEFISAYSPIRNRKNDVIAYLNLPYFARENELNLEISSFISTFINVYLLIALITVFITILISNYVTLPLRIIKDKLRNIKLGANNEKINWKRKDEIGDLVFEYNKMIEELADKANLLAQSERESAWREMAKQVAHEIKNPLTPMKLSTQYLQKAWKDDAPDFNERMERFSKTMIEQINNLSDIATAFSHFGKMPESAPNRICLNDVLSNVVTLFRSEDYDINLSIPDSAIYITADENQMQRVFNNLIKNAQQSFAENRRGIIDISLSSDENSILIVIKDNGIGISEEQKKKIFQPNFTTKSSGTGLGLAIVKNIVSSFNGKIWFESVENLGTVFSIEFLVEKK